MTHSHHSSGKMLKKYYSWLIKDFQCTILKTFSFVIFKLERNSEEVGNDTRKAYTFQHF